MKKIIVVEGVDGSGKQTQSTMLYESLFDIMDNIELLSFPNYDSTSSALVKMYLNGEISEDFMDISPYAASMFYAADRYITYRQKMEKKMEGEGFFIMDRYTPSNIIYQASKVKKSKRPAFIDWLEDFEYNKLGIPKPDMVFFLDMPVWAAKILTKDRINKITGETKQDVHESNELFLQKAYENGMEIAEKLHFTIIKCVDEEKILSPEEIHKKILDHILKA